MYKYFFKKGGGQKKLPSPPKVWDFLNTMHFVEIGERNNGRGTQKVLIFSNLMSN